MIKNFKDFEEKNMRGPQQNGQTRLGTGDYTVALESEKAVRDWLNAKAKLRYDSAYQDKDGQVLPCFGHFIDGEMTQARADFINVNPAKDQAISVHSEASDKEIDGAFYAAQKAQKLWAKCSGFDRGRYLYALARMLNKHSRLLAVLETVDNGKPIRESRDIDIPLVIRHFYYFAGLAQLYETDIENHQPIGVCAQIIPWNFPLLMLAWKIAPALAAGNTVVLKTAEQTPLTALLFAEICQNVGLPKGVVNILTGGGEVGAKMVVHPLADKIAFTGSTEVGRSIRKATAGKGKALTLELGGKSPFIVFEDADIEAAIEGVVDSIWLNQSEACGAGSRLLLQQSIAEAFHKRLKARMIKLRQGDPLDKNTDIGALVSQTQFNRVTADVQKVVETALFQSPSPLPEKGFYFPPTLIANTAASDDLMHKEIFGPVLISTTFRHYKEAIALANDSIYGLAAMIWTENMNTALELAYQVKAGVVWVNASNTFDAAVGFGGMRESGFGREGGWESVRSYGCERARLPLREVADSPARVAGAIGKKPPKAGVNKIDIHKTYKLYIDGKQCRADGNESLAVATRTGDSAYFVAKSGQKDVRNAVEAATKATSSWQAKTQHNRAQLLYYMAENLHSLRCTFADCLRLVPQVCSNVDTEIDATIRRLFYYGAWCDKFDGDVHTPPIKALSIAIKQPLGTVGLIMPEASPLLALVSLLAPVFAMGNTSVILVSRDNPLIIGPLIQLFECSDIPKGVLNVLSGHQVDTVPTMAAHTGMDGLWHFGHADWDKHIEESSASHFKRTWCHSPQIDWYHRRAQGELFLSKACEVKNIWIPYGQS